MPPLVQHYNSGSLPHEESIALPRGGTILSSHKSHHHHRRYAHAFNILGSSSNDKGHKTTINRESTMVYCYFSAKLAPPISGVSVESVESRVDGHSWFTIQIYPCHVTIPGSDAMPIPRKSYCIYRRYEDVADFMHQIEGEFPWLRSSLSTERKVLGVFSMTFREKAHPLVRPRGGSTTDTLQLKSELDRYLQNFFLQSSMITQCRLVAEFFGIWKTDLEARLSEAHQDPLALHSLITHAHKLDRNEEKPQILTKNNPSRKNCPSSVLWPLDSTPCSSAPASPTFPLVQSQIDSDVYCGGRAASSSMMVGSLPSSTRELPPSPPGSSYHSDQSSTDDDYDGSSSSATESDDEDLALKFPVRIITKSISFQTLGEPDRCGDEPPSALAHGLLDFDFPLPPFFPFSPSSSSYDQALRSFIGGYTPSISSAFPATTTTVKPRRPSSLNPEARPHSISTIHVPEYPSAKHPTLAPMTSPLLSSSGGCLATSPLSKSHVFTAVRPESPSISKSSDCGKTSRSFYSILKAFNSEERVVSSAVTAMMNPGHLPSRPSTPSVSCPNLPREDPVRELECSLEQAFWGEGSPTILNLTMTPEFSPVKRSYNHFQSLPINTCHLFGLGSRSGLGSAMKLTRSPAMLRKKKHHQNSSMSILMNGSRWTDIERRAGSDVDDDGVGGGIYRRKHSNQEQDYYRFPANHRRHIPQGEEGDYEQDYRHGRRRERATNPIPISALFSVPVPDKMDSCASRSGYNPKNPSCGDTYRYHYPGTRAFIATFKIVVDAERIVALQVWEDDEDFMLSIPDLRLRVRKKFEKAEIPLPDDFELMWTAWNGESIILKNDEELRRAMHASANSKVTLTCIC